MLHSHQGEMADSRSYPLGNSNLSQGDRNSSHHTQQHWWLWGWMELMLCCLQLKGWMKLVHYWSATKKKRQKPTIQHFFSLQQVISTDYTDKSSSLVQKAEFKHKISWFILSSGSWLQTQNFLIYSEVLIWRNNLTRQRKMTSSWKRWIEEINSNS